MKTCLTFQNFQKDLWYLLLSQYYWICEAHLCDIYSCNILSSFKVIIFVRCVECHKYITYEGVWNMVIRAVCDVYILHVTYPNQYTIYLPIDLHTYHIYIIHICISLVKKDMKWMHIPLWKVTGKRAYTCNSFLNGLFSRGKMCMSIILKMFWVVWKKIYFFDK